MSLLWTQRMLRGLERKGATGRSLLQLGLRNHLMIAEH